MQFRRPPHTSGDDASLGPRLLLLRGMVHETHSLRGRARFDGRPTVPVSVGCTPAMELWLSPAPRQQRLEFPLTVQGLVMDGGDLSR